ncbi:hypothetical protein [Rufibacter soli]
MPAKARTNLSFGVTEIMMQGYVPPNWNRRFYQEGFRWMRGAYIKRGTTPDDFEKAHQLAEEYNSRFDTAA